ncbi:MAG: acetylxylan esterase [Planctomycetes bacterium]|nr:acetylxylan esterase [Planctomycetota bacterium]
MNGGASHPGFAHGFDFDPACGCSEAELLAIAPPSAPPGFDAFWMDAFAIWARLEKKLTYVPLPSPSSRHALVRVDADAWEGIRIGAWLVAPVSGKVVRGVVVGHGYGGRSGPDLREPEPGTAIIYPCAPGFDLSARVDLPSVSDQHVLHGIATRDSYLIRACVASMWSAASVLMDRYPGITHLSYEGGSFGGGLGALALPWDARFHSAALIVPTFGHHPWRLRCPSIGSGEAVRRYHRDHPQVMEVLAFYDAATAAARIRIPTLVAPARFDPAVAPPGQFAVANALVHRKLLVLSAGHFAYPAQAQEEASLRAAIDGWQQLPGRGG